MGSFKEVSKIAGAFVGVIVGAGFASGQEILQFFASFGSMGLVGCVVAGIVFVLLSMAFSTMGQRLLANSHREVINAMLGKHLGAVFDLLITFFLFAITVVMLAGAGSLLNQWLGVPELWGSVIATIATVLIVCLDVASVISFIGAAAASCVSVRNEAATSAANTASPLWKRALGLSLNVTERPSEASATSSASKPYMANGSSSLFTISVSSVSAATPASWSPLSVNGLSVSKPPGTGSVNVPPLGACGLT